MAWLQSFIDKYHFAANTYAGTGNLKQVIDDISSDAPNLRSYGQSISGSYDLDPGELEEFWKNMEIVTGKKFDTNHRNNLYFSCSC